MNCIISGILTGAIFALIGYAKSMPVGESFDWKKFLPTILIGSVSGIIACRTGADIVTVSGKLTEYGVIALVNGIWLAVLKNYKPVKRKIKILSKKLIGGDVGKPVSCGQ